MSAEATLRCEGLAKIFGRDGTAVAALRDVSLAIGAREVVALMGPSGSGKSTLLSLAGGLLGPTRGRLWVDGVELSEFGPDGRRAAVRGRVGYVFQRILLLAELTALENAVLGATLGGLPWREASARARRLLERLGLGHRRQAMPAALSMGEQQRVALARALAIGPRLLLADEPTASLDWPTGRVALEALVALAREQGAAILLATHDERVLEFATRVIRLHDGAVAEDRLLAEVRA